MKCTLRRKFGGPAQRWDRADLGKGGVGWNPGPPFSPPRARGERGRKEGGRRGGGMGAWVGSMHHPLPWLPPQRYAKIVSF
jgi:hypothetical protein